MPKIVITGGAGFIGSNLTERFIKAGWEVVAIDDLSFGSRTNLAAVLDQPGFTFIESDIRQPGVVSKACRNANCLVHLAAYKIPRYGDALKTLLVNNDGTRRALEAACEFGIKTILASTSDVYGKNLNPPFKEDNDLVVGPPFVRRWAYAVSKTFDEQLAMAFYTERELPVVILRFFGSYGPHNHRSWWGGPQAVFIEEALREEPLTVHGDGRQTRTFCYVSDTIEGIRLAVESPEAIGQVINIGSELEINILSLAEKIIEMTGSKSTIELIPYEQIGGNYEDVRHRVPDIAKARALLGFEPQVSLHEGLKKTIGWHRLQARRGRSTRA